MLPIASDFTGLYAGFERRLKALIVDYMILILFYGILLVTAEDYSRLAQRFAHMDYGFALGLFVVGWLYWAGFESSPLMATPGKRAAEMRVTDMDGERISFARASARYFAKLLSAAPLLLGFLMAEFMPRRQALHDLIAHTLVVRAMALDGAKAVPADATATRPVMSWNRLPAMLGWSVLAALVALIAWVSITANQDFLAREQTSEAFELAGGGEVGLSEYYEANHHWPPQLSSVYSTAEARPAGRYVLEVKMWHCAAERCAVAATLDPEKALAKVAGGTLVVWTLDGGQTWHCGPGGANPVEPKYLSGSCREQSPL